MLLESSQSYLNCSWLNLQMFFWKTLHKDNKVVRMHETFLSNISERQLAGIQYIGEYILFIPHIKN